MQFLFKIGRTLKDPSIFFSNPNCSEAKCPTDQTCEGTWKFNLQQYDVDIDLRSFTNDPTVKLKCISTSKGF